MTRGLPQPDGRAKLSLRWTGALALGLAVALASGCGMYGDLMLEERPVRTPEITEVEPISVPPGGAPDVPAPPGDLATFPPSDAAESGAADGDGDQRVRDDDRDGDKNRNEDDPAGSS